MKTLVWTFFIVLLIAGIAIADATIVEFSGQPTESGNELVWQTGVEEDVELFIVQRSTNNQDFSTIGEVAAKGSNSSYEFLDANPGGISTIYYYHLRIRNGNGTFQNSESISVIPVISGFSRTWGTIKALFQ